MPRSGTTLLAGLLTNTKCMGRPGEWFNPRQQPPWARRDYARFVDRVVRSRPVNGVLGVKFLHNQLWYFLEELRALPQAEGRSDRELLEQVFPGPSFVWVERRDVIAQAVSWWRANRTEEWGLPLGAKKRRKVEPPSFDFAEIRGLLIEIERGNKRWREWFAENEIDPHVVVYEDLAAHQDAVTRATLRFLEIDVPPSVQIKPRTARQADELNAMWIARFRQMSAESLD